MVKNQRKKSAQAVTPAAVQYLCVRQMAVRPGKVCALENPCQSSMKNSVGKPYEGKLHVQFEKGGADSLHIVITLAKIIMGRLSGSTLLRHYKKTSQQH